jgi:copper homeostasis protein (lipoprotein)
MKNMRKLLLFTSLIMVSACTKKAYNHHNSMNSLDWSGTYKGLLFLDKKEYNSVLTLNDDLSYDLNLNGVKTSGDFVWSPDGGRIKILQNQHPFELFVGENHLIMLDKKGKSIKEDHYKLIKQNEEAITEKYWKLVELNGKPVEVKEGMPEPHLILKADNRVNGNGGCNGFFGEYELNESTLRLSFSKVGSTMMACSAPNVESEFHKVLNTVDNYTTDGENLSLNKARMAPLARFKVVYLK